MKTSFRLLEKWKNRGQNGTIALGEFETFEEAHKAMGAKVLEAAVNFGDDFPPTKPRLGTITKNKVKIYIGGYNENICEYFREFFIAERGKWDFHYDEETPDPYGRNFMGVLTDGIRFMFWHAYAEDEGQGETCHIYDSLRDLYEHENEVCSYPWTAENDSILLEALNGLDDPDDFCGEGSPIMRTEFIR